MLSVPNGGQHRGTRTREIFSGHRRNGGDEVTWNLTLEELEPQIPL